jgi:PAS domain S-box-containing protein
VTSRPIILIVDDREANLVALEAVLAPLGHRVVRALTGEDALRRALELDFALILLDVFMPDLDGFELLALLRARERSRGTPVIFLTGGSSDPQHVSRAYREGAVDYLVKPFDPDMLRAKVSVFVELYRSRDAISRQAAALRERERERELLLEDLVAITRAQARAESSAATYRLLAETIPQQVWTATPDGALDYVSSVVVDYFQRSAEDIRAAGWPAFIHPDDLPACRARWLAALASGDDYEAELRLLRHDGSYRWHLGRGVCERDDAGKIVRWFGTNTDIHDRKLHEAEQREREAALIDSQARLRLALDAGQMGDWEWRIRDGKVTWSAALEAMHGLPAGSFAGSFEAYQRDIHPDDRERVLATAQQSLSQARHDLRYRIIRPDGAVRWLEAHGKVIHDEAGPVRIVGVCSDVTERLEVEDATRRLAAKEAARRAAVHAEERTRQVLESISDPMFVFDQDWQLSYVNEAGAALLGRPRAALEGALLWEVFPEAVGSIFEREYHRAREEDVRVSFEAFFAPRAAWFDVTAYPTRDGRLSVHYRNISARKESELRLAREARHAALRADIGLALAHPGDQASILQACTDAFVRHLGVAHARVWTLDQESGGLELQASAGLDTPEDGGRARAPAGKYQIGRIVETRAPHLTNDVAHDPYLDDPAWAAAHGLVAFAGYPLLAQKRAVGVVAMFAREALPADTLNAIAAVADAIAQSIERGRAELALEARARDLARSNAELEQFAYVASHDLQEPLRMVASYTQLLGRRYRGKLDAAADEFIGFAVDGANRMQALIDDLLEFSRVGTRPGRIEKLPLELPLGKALVNLTTAIGESGAQISHDPLPVLRMDAAQLVQLFQNLIGNAIKFRGTTSPVVHVGARAEDGHWVISVSDNGIGISEEFFSRLFVLFQRLHTRSEYPGNGIGLAICKKIVERHGGRIWVESTPGRGTCFSFTLRDEAS